MKVQEAMEAIKLLSFAFRNFEQLFPWLNNLAKASKSKSKQTPILVIPVRLSVNQQIVRQVIVSGIQPFLKLQCVVLTQCHI